MLALADDGIASKIKAHKQKLARGVEEKSRKVRSQK
jgi:hypothetical protein